MRRLRGLVLIGALVMPLLAHASQESRQLQALGLVEFHAGRYTKALELFDKAVAADSGDVYSQYYRGVTRSRLGNINGAVEDLRAVLAAQPDLDAATLDLGVALVQSGKFRDAVPLLEQAQRNRELDAQASLFLGVAQLRLEEINTARTNFVRAAARDPALKTSATYYGGVADYREGYYDSANEQFKAVAAGSPDSEMGREATAFLAKIQQRDRPKFQGSGSVGFQYDSNIVLAPGNDVALGITRQGGGRATIDLNGTYAVWRADQAELSLSYEFYQSLHFDPHNFNNEPHRMDLTANGPGVQLVGTIGLVNYGVSGRYDYYLLDGDNFLQEVNAFPWIAVPEGNWGRTEVFYRMRRRDFLDVDFRIRDGFNHATGFNQYFYVKAPDNYVSVGYRFDREDPLNARPQIDGDANQFAYDGHQVSVGCGWMLPFDISAYAGYMFEREHYAKAPSAGRRDEIHQPTVLVSRRLNEYLTLTGAYFGTFNKSNKSSNPSYDYDRHVVSVALEVRF